MPLNRALRPEHEVNDTLKTFEVGSAQTVRRLYNPTTQPVRDPNAKTFEPLSANAYELEH